MRIFDAYDDASVRIWFKEFIEAEGVSVSKREQIYTRFGTYISRIRGVRFDKLLLEARDENDFREKLNTIFFDKWKDHLGYPEIPDYFFHYLDFLHTAQARYDHISIEGLSEDDGSQITDSGVTRYEQRFMTPDGKLRILANPSLIRLLKQSNLWVSPAGDEAVECCADFYKGCGLNMDSEAWKKIIDTAVNQKSRKGKRGDISFEIKDTQGSVAIYNSFQAFEHVISLAGIDKIAKCSLKLNGQPVVTNKIPAGRDASFKKLEDGYYLNCTGSLMDRFKLLRALISLFRLPLELNMSKEKSVKSKPKTRKPQTVSQPDPARLTTPIPIVTPHEQPDNDFTYGKDGTLNLFDDL